MKCDGQQAEDIKMRDRHLNVIEKNTMDNVCKKSKIEYRFKDGFILVVPERLRHEEEHYFYELHGKIETIKKADSI